MQEKVQTADIHAAAFLELSTNTRANIVSGSADGDRSIFIFPGTPEIAAAIVAFNRGEVAPALAFGEKIRQLRRRCFQHKNREGAR